MITPEEIDRKEFKTTRLGKGYDADEVDAFLDRITSNYRDILNELGVARHALQRAADAPTQAFPTVYSDVDRLLAVAQETADKQIASANGQAGEVLAEAQKQASAIVQQGHNERHAIVGKLEVQRAELEQVITQHRAAQTEMANTMRSALTALEAGQ